MEQGALDTDSYGLFTQLSRSTLAADATGVNQLDNWLFDCWTEELSL
jgi:hypothetical protein